MEKRSLELEKLKEDLEERERAVSKRAKEADESVELLEREKVRQLWFGGIQGRCFALFQAGLCAVQMTGKLEIFLPILSFVRSIRQFFLAVERDVAVVPTDVQACIRGRGC
jgi:hypothetical protein